MQHIAAIAQKALRNGRGESTKKEPVNERTEDLFMLLSVAFPYKFLAQFPTDNALDVGKRMWQRVLADVPGQAIANGIEVLAKSAVEWQPTPGEFRKMCLDASKPKTEVHKCLPSPKSDATKVAGCMERIRGALNGNLR